MRCPARSVDSRYRVNMTPSYGGRRGDTDLSDGFTLMLEPLGRTALYPTQNMHTHTKWQAIHVVKL